MMFFDLMLLKCLHDHPPYTSLMPLLPAIIMPKGPFLVLFLLVFVGGPLLFLSLIYLLIRAGRRDASLRKSQSESPIAAPPRTPLPQEDVPHSRDDPP